MEVQMEIGDIGAKFQSFGWKVIEIDGHNMTEIVDAIKLANDDQNEPYAIVAHTVKGKGVSFMENNPAFHGKAPTDEELIIALEELS
jgi:transketolase